MRPGVTIRKSPIREKPSKGAFCCKSSALKRMRLLGLMMAIGGVNWLAVPDKGAFAASDLSITGHVGIESDLRDRGLSLSDFEPSPFLSLELSHQTGFFVGLFAAFGLEAQRGPLQNMPRSMGSSPSDRALDALGLGVYTARTELEFYGGYGFRLGAYDLSLSAELDSFHDHKRQDAGLGQEGRGAAFAQGEQNIRQNLERYFPEFKASLSRDLGLIFGRFSVSYAPKGRWFTPQEESVYLRGDLEIPIPRFSQTSIIARFGHDIRASRADISDFAIGLSYFTGAIEWTVFWQDSAQDKIGLYNPGKARLSFGVGFYF